MKVIQSKALINQGTLIVRLVIAKSDKHFVLSKIEGETLVFPSTPEGIITSHQPFLKDKDMTLQECIHLMSKHDWHSSCLTHVTHGVYNTNEKSQLKKLGETLDGGGDIKENKSISKPQPRDITNDIKDKTLELLGQTWVIDNVDDQLYQCILTSEDGLALLECWLRYYTEYYKNLNPDKPIPLASIPAQCVSVAKRCATQGLASKAYDILNWAFTTDHTKAKWLRKQSYLGLHHLCNQRVFGQNYNYWLRTCHTPKAFEVVGALPQLDAPVYDENGFLIGGSNGQS